MKITIEQVTRFRFTVDGCPLGEFRETERWQGFIKLLNTAGEMAIVDDGSDGLPSFPGFMRIFDGDATAPEKEVKGWSVLKMSKSLLDKIEKHRASQKTQNKEPVTA